MQDLDQNGEMINPNVKDIQKFKIMTKVYEEIFINKATFINISGISRSTVFDWFKKENANINTKSKTKICQTFKLIDTVWSDIFYTEEDFEERLPDYKKIEKKSTIRIWTPLEKSTKQTTKLSEIEGLSAQQKETLFANKLVTKSASFMFSFAVMLKNKKQIEKALEVLEWIQNGDNAFKYTHENQIKHLKAILLSHDNIKDWDGAIDILRSLYHSSAYHLKEPEILTLLASNYKRKALDSADSKEQINMNFLTSALCLYEDAMQLKPDNQKFYDAINLAYLYKIVDVIELEYADKLELDILAKTISDVSNKEDWWEVSSKAEFLMLLGKVDIALSFINGFLENYTINPSLYKIDSFKTDVLFRQLKLYIKFTEDENAKRFLREVEESWENINE